MLEEWRDVVGYEGLYTVSNLGRVVGPRKMLKPFITRFGYERVFLCKNGKQRNKPVHRLAAIAFIENKENKPQVNHKDGVKTNNKVSNLEWATAKENIDHMFNVLGLGLGPRSLRGEKHHFSKPFYMIDDKGVKVLFGCIRELAELKGLSRAAICQMAQRGAGRVIKQGKLKGWMFHSFKTEGENK